MTEPLRSGIPKALKSATFGTRYLAQIFGRLGIWREGVLLADAEFAEDEVQNVIACRGAS
jgi:hypothetical protein